MLFDKTVVFAFIVKDGEEYLPSNLEVLDGLGRLFRRHYIRYVENDSADATRDILDAHPTAEGKQMTLQDGRHSTELCAPNEINCPARLRRLAYIRNTLLDTIEETTPPTDLMVLFDLDFVDIDEPGFKRVVSRLLASPELDGVFGMSVNKKNELYDVGALRPLSALIPVAFHADHVPVESAFSGVGVYRRLRTAGHRYDTKTSDIEHVSFNRGLRLEVDSNFNPVFVPSSDVQLYNAEAIQAMFCVVIIVALMVVVGVTAGVLRKQGKL